MSRIAVAGGTGGFGKTFVEALLQTQHHVIILSRGSSNVANPNVECVKVDYSDIHKTAAVLDHHAIDTVWSALIMDVAEAAQAQLSLIAAAELSKATTRFIPSEYASVTTPDMVIQNPWCKPWLESANALAKTNLQWTRVAAGIMLDYWGMPHIKTSMAEFFWAVDVANRKAIIPGSGNTKFSTTYSYDLARVIIRLLEEKVWPRHCAVSGQDITFNQLLNWAEQATQHKFDVTYEPLSALEEGVCAPINDRMKASELNMSLVPLLGALLEQGELLLPTAQGFRLNKRFPDMKLLAVNNMISQIWGR